MTTAAEIPQSQALTEANPDSLAELFARDPEGLGRQDRDRIIEALRAQRARVANAEASGQKKPRAVGVPKLPLSSTAPGQAEDMGL